ncbi:trehalose hydrolase [Chitinophaga sp. SYP-B3965]|uniref:glycosyl hydrolase family 95 catalytic domain-containing protein n=1 Tax=Chitinophaga sp. SYP-B3965 TaxID=2663120 RepID=UPI00129A01AB|nr:trehalose hydrolase [Chitinophaga sp. SYP-B3965]MRG44740.1 trehalose hydrolase [Chitinophaga sp. SYP-B3965]
MKISRLLLSFCFITQAAAQTPGNYSFVYTSAPQNVPTAKVPDAPLAGNGDIGLTFGGTPEHLKLYIGKNDFWRAYPVYPGGGIAFPGGLDIIINELKDAQYYAEQLPTKGAIHAVFTKNDLKVEVNSLVTAMHNTVITEITTNKTCKVNLDLWAPEGNTAVVKKGPNWVSRSFSGTPLLEWPTEVVLAMKVYGDQQLQPGKKLTVTVTVGKTNKPEENVEKMKAAHQQWWNQFWKRSSIRINDTMLEKYYTNSQYLFASSSREGKYAPGIWGPFITKDSSAWGGDYHLNYNYQAPYWAAFSSNYIDLTDNYDQPLLDYMEKGRWHAKDLLNMRGIYFPVGIGPRGLCTTLWPLTPDEMEARYGTRENTIDHGYKFLGQKINAVFGAANMLMRFYSTYDEKYAEKVYPYLLACADFWEDYLKFTDGRYVIENDHYGEVMPNLKNKGQWRHMLGDYNSTLSLGLVKMLFKGMINVSTYLNKDAARQAKWQHILTHLSPFPTQEIDGRVRLKSVEKSPSPFHSGAMGLARVSIHGLILPGEVCGPVTDSAFNAILLSDVSHWKDKMQEPGSWGNTFGNGIETCFPAAVRVGYDADEIIKQLKARINAQSLRNGWITAAGGGTETLSAVPLTINEMLLQSYEGRIRIFPNWNHSRDAKFNNLRAYGAFVISSSLKNGRVEYVTLQSEKGRTCEMENPWPGKAVKLTRNNKPASSTLTGRAFTFNTSKNELIQLSPLE